ncbi:metallophosphoesterase family protein [Pseudalkalibacillus decolorationis]|uniref:metallophosphoesterase family protein n=1 Tax=Pseudalkalibacillus decolorationis TaxID=163879 RepID=UPI0021494240|nr:DNA repair exonuclease [Pseudalkalibacillus decolorationis]
MTTIRFIHTADLHIDTPFIGLSNLPKTILEQVKKSTFTSFGRIVAKAISERVDFIVIAGDLYNGANRGLTAQMFLRNEFQRLADHGIQVYIIHGNHDHLSGEWAQITWPENVHYFNGPTPSMIPYTREGEVLAHLYGYSYPKRAVTENIASHYNRVEGAPYHIALLHGTAGGSTEHANYAPFLVSELNQQPFDYWALGHIHKQKVLHEDPTIIYPGNIQGLNPKETGKKGCFLVELSNYKTTHTFYETSPIGWEILELDIDDMNEVDELIQFLQKEKNIIRRSQRNAIITIKLSGGAAVLEYLSKRSAVDELVQILQDGEDEEGVFVWIHRITVAENRKNIADIAESHFVNEIISVIEETDNLKEVLSPLYKHRIARKFLDKDDLEEQEILEEARRLLLDSMIQT